jgi:hypothetical protein
MLSLLGWHPGNGIGLPFSSPDVLHGDYRNGLYLNAAGAFGGYYLNTVDITQADPSNQINAAATPPAGCNSSHRRRLSAACALWIYDYSVNGSIAGASKQRVQSPCSARQSG